MCSHLPVKLTKTIAIIFLDINNHTGTSHIDTKTYISPTKADTYLH